MNTKQMFWGLFFVTLGILFVLDQYSSFYFDWYFVSDYWPLIFVLWGLIVILKDSKVKPVLSGLAGLWMAVIIYSFFLNITFTGDFVFDEGDEYTTSIYSEDFEPGTDFAELRVAGGMGKFSIVDGTDKLVYARAKGSFAEYYFSTRQDDDLAYIKLYQEKEHFHFFDEDFRNRLEIQMNTLPVWDLGFELGASSTYLDLTKYKVRRLELDQGAAKTRVKLGDLYNDTQLDVEMGAAKLELEIPRESGCKITGDMVLVLKTLDGFRKVEDYDEYWVTDNYDDAKNKIHLHIESGVSTLKVRRR